MTNVKYRSYISGDDYIIFERYDHGDGERWCLYHEEQTVDDWGTEIWQKHGYLYGLHAEDVAMLIKRITTEGSYQHFFTKYEEA